MWFYKSREFTDDMILDNFGFIYLITYENGRMYIGQKYFHADWKRYVGGGMIVKDYVKKHGEAHVRDNAKRTIVALGKDENELNQLESWYIYNYNAVESDRFWNLKPGGKNSSHSDVSRQKISNSLQGNKLNSGHKKKLSLSKKKVWKDGIYDHLKKEITVVFKIGGRMNFESSEEAGRKLGINPGHIRRWKSGIRPIPSSYNISQVI